MTSTTAATPDLHLLYATRALTKARTFLSRSSGANASGVHPHHQRVSLGSSLSKSPNNGYSTPSGSSLAANALVNSEVNRRDERGRTVLHLACSETDPWALEWIEALLALGGCQVNLQDDESGWTALHRAMYVGNVAAARMLLARSDIDPRAKDHEGLTPFDLYNSTVEGTNPSDSPVFALPPRLDLLTWGANRNYVLGYAGDSDRAYPERVNLRRDNATGIEAHQPVRVKDISMARLHSAIVTDEPKINVRLCGYGTGGRLGQSGHTIFTFTALKDFPHTVSSVVLSPDHTVIVTASGGLWTFGTNRFSQLGYTIDTPSPAIPGGVPDEAVQMVPRKVLGALKKEVVLGAAASRTHTVAYTADSLFTWGTNKGQLGYAIAGSSIQLLPRKVTAVAQPVIMATATENATACLLEGRDVVVLWREGYVRVVFPMSRFPTRMQVYHPPQFSGKANITKIASCGSTFAALSSHGDVFTFSLSDGPAGSDAGSPLAKAAPTPQRIWSLRRKFTAVTDIAVGLDGTVILSTVSGHVFVRTRKFESTTSSSASKSLSGSNSGTSTPVPRNANSGWKFSRVPYLQRVVKVAANSTGGFAAIRYDVPLKPVDIEGSPLAQDLAGILPHWRRAGSLPVVSTLTTRRHRTATEADSDDDNDDDETENDAAIHRDVEVALTLLSIKSQWDTEWEMPLAGSDAYLTADGKRVPVHRSVVSRRSASLESMLQESDTIDLDCSFLALLLFCQYLYTDSMPPLWDSRVGAGLRSYHPDLTLDIAQTKADLQRLAKQFKLDALSLSLSYHSKHAPAPTLSRDIGSLIAPNASTESADIVLALADRDVFAHSSILRARCHFFETLYEESDWTSGRLGEEGEPIRFEMDHVEWDVMRLVVRHIYIDAGVELFSDVERATADEFIDYVLQVMAVANELLLDKLKSVCSAVLGTFVTLNNVCSILSEAAFYEATDLARACMLYMACSMETLLEGHYLDDLPVDLLAGLSVFVQERQALRLPISRSGLLVTELLTKHAKWLSEQDVPKLTGGYRKWRPPVNGLNGSRSPGPSPSMLVSPDASPMIRPSASPSMRPIPGAAAVSPTAKSPFLLPRSVVITSSSHPGAGAAGNDDEPFSMDDDFSLDSSPTTTKPSAPRRSSTNHVVSPSSTTVLGSPPPPRLQPWSTTTASSSTMPSSSSLAGAGAGAGASASEQKKADLRSIMANEEARSKPATRPITSNARPPQQPQQSQQSSWKPVGQGWQVPTIGTSASAWTETTRRSLSSIQRQQQTTPSKPSRSNVPQTSGIASTRPIDARTAINAPVFTPGRPLVSNTASGNGTLSPRSVSGGTLASSSKGSFTGGDVPWTNYTSPVAATPSSPLQNSYHQSDSQLDGRSNTPTRTLASIQSEQAAQNEAIRNTKAPRSFADLMKADESALQARREEEAFAKWWEEESRRVQGIAKDAMADVPSTAPGVNAVASASNSNSTSNSNGGAVRGRGRGRGGGKGRGGRAGSGATGGSKGPRGKGKE